MDFHDIEMEVFKSGNYGPKGNYSDDDLEKIAADYEPRLLEAPLTFDHAQSGPAYGWVSQLRRHGSRLVATLTGVPTAVRELMVNGRFKRRSVELFRLLPETGRPYLRAVSLLGAATPEVKGLREVTFSAAPDEESVLKLTDSDPAETESENTRLRAELRHRDTAALFADLRREGYCLSSRDAEALAQLAGAAADDVLRFSDETEQPLLHWLRSFIQGAALRAPLGQAAEGSTPPASAPVVPPHVEPRSFELHRRAVAFMEQQPGMAYRDALQRVASL